ncbi:hypothetical protein BU15DRAFT_46407 [Melanogaster broomeanus]|nr:hypothetical protein BU15DRAFT_46407 [Melanogaster broomeanus]
MPYPTTHPDISVFEDMSEQYTSVSTPGAQASTPRTSSETLASLVSIGNFQAAEALRQEMVAHNIPITNDFVYVRAALNVIPKLQRAEDSTQRCIDSFEEWLSLLPDRHVRLDLYSAIRDRIFHSLGHLNLQLAYRFGLVLASKGYYGGKAANQVVAYLARFTWPSVLQRYLQELEGRARDYHSRTGIPHPTCYLHGIYSVGVRTSAITGRAEGALQLISIAHSRGIRVSDRTLSVVVGYAPNQQYAIDQIRIVYPSWSMPLQTSPDRIVRERGFREGSTDVTTLAAHLRFLRNTLRSTTPPSPYAIINFITSYQALSRTSASASAHPRSPTRVLTLLRALAHRHSKKSTGIWALTEMLYHRQRKEYIHVLLAFFRFFHPVGIPIKLAISLVRGPLGQQAREESAKRLVRDPYLTREKLWPSAEDAALVWEAVLFFSSKIERHGLYTLLLTLVKKSRQQDSEAEVSQGTIALQLPPVMFNDAHFSPFIIPLAKHSPWKASEVLRDMVGLGIEPKMVQWSIIARGYAQHGDPAIALRILDRVEEIELETNNGADNGEESPQQDVPRRPSDMLLGTHTNVLRGFALGGELEHARHVEKRLVERFGYQAGYRAATDAAISLLREREEAA